METYLRNVLNQLYNDLCSMSKAMTGDVSDKQASLRRKWIRTLDNYLEVNELIVKEMKSIRGKVERDATYIENEIEETQRQREEIARQINTQFNNNLKK